MDILICLIGEPANGSLEELCIKELDLFILTTNLMRNLWMNHDEEYDEDQEEDGDEEY